MSYWNCKTINNLKQIFFSKMTIKKKRREYIFSIGIWTCINCGFALAYYLSKVMLIF